ncbi:MAG: hypothetical protein PHN49_04840 [Candidatus Omnitrophica bacterium]|nr:hypothetical protein [Candidatus Omnitrophota bacterium]MDD5670947.1 hypothetical protein [Candidatus Omnitrophota bacterium]
MSNKMRLLVILLVGLSLVFGSQLAFAKQGGNIPSGWGKGEKKGWGGKSTPPGMAKKEGATAKKNMKMKMQGMKKGGVAGKGTGTQAQ